MTEEAPRLEVAVKTLMCSGQRPCQLSSNSKPLCTAHHTGMLMYLGHSARVRHAHDAVAGTWMQDGTCQAWKAWTTPSQRTTVESP